MTEYRTIHGIRVVEWDELDGVLFQLELSTQTTEDIDGCLSEPDALEALAHLAEFQNAVRGNCAR